jgi:MFS family permease
MIQSGFTPSALAHLADITETFAHDRGAIMGLYSVFLGLGQFIGSSIGGPFVDWLGADGMVLSTALLGAVAGILLLRMQSIEHQSLKKELSRQATVGANPIDPLNLD